MKIRLTTLFAIALLLGGCATGPRYDTANVNHALTPAQASRVEAMLGQSVLWGGMIVNGINLQDKTQIEVVGYPLSRAQKPAINDPPQGRFLIMAPGYLETAQYAPGRLITVRGEIKEQKQGMIGESGYTYPVVVTDQVYLWPREEPVSTEPRLHFGIGVIFGN